MNYSKTKSYFAHFKRSVPFPFMAVAASDVRSSWGFVCFGCFFCGFFSFFCRFCLFLSWFSCCFWGLFFSSPSLISLLSFLSVAWSIPSLSWSPSLSLLLSPGRSLTRSPSRLFSRSLLLFPVFHLFFFRPVVFLVTPFLLSISFSCIFLQFFVSTFGCFSSVVIRLVFNFA